MRDVKDKPTVRQVYALAAVLCERVGQGFPETREEASGLIERLRVEVGHPSPRLAGVAPRPSRRRRWRGPRGTCWADERRASDVAAALVGEMR